MIRLPAFLTCILLSTFIATCFAQKKDDIYASDNKGSYAKGKNVLITDDLNFSVDNFVKGYMILPSNALQYGYLRFNGNKVIFKDSVTNKTTRYSADEIKGFVCDIVDSIKTQFLDRLYKRKGLFDFSENDPNKNRFFSRSPEGFLLADTFKVYLHTYQALQDAHMASFGKKMITDKYFVKVMVSGSSLTLYKRVETRQSGMGSLSTGGVSHTAYDVNIFYMQRPGEKDYTELPSGKRAFKKLMQDYLKDNTPLTEDIKNDVLGYNDLDKIVLRYNNKP